MKYLNDALNLADNTWQQFLLANLYDDLLSIDECLAKISLTENIFPPAPLIFRCLKYPVYEQKVVILGQDPYHGYGQANGLAFAVNSDIAMPPSLNNIYKEIIQDQNLVFTSSFFDKTLESWLEQKVMLLNSSLTVIENKPNSLVHIGWQRITDAIIKRISDENMACVFMLWGNYAKDKACLIDTNKHLVLQSSHPSPLSAYKGFLGCKHFSLANEFLSQTNQKIIDWL